MSNSKIISTIKNREYLYDALKYRSGRREFVIDKIYKFSSQFHNIELNKNDILNSIECFHTSASIIDDIQDYEEKRKGTPSYYVRQGYGNSAFASLNLWNYGLEILSKNYNISIVLNILRDLINCQETDVGLFFGNKDLFISYFEKSSLKMAFELKLIYYLCCPLQENELNSKVNDVIFEIGKLIQYIDDKNDELDNFEEVLNIKTEQLKLNLSLPFVLAIKYNNMDQSSLFAEISKNEALEIYFKFVDKPIIHEQIEKIINNQIDLIEFKINQITTYNTTELKDLFCSVKNLNFSNNNIANETIV